MIEGAVTFATTPNAFIECQCRAISAHLPTTKLGRAVNIVMRITSAAFFSRGGAELILKSCNQAGGNLADAFKSVWRGRWVITPAPKGGHVVIRGAWSPLQFITVAHSAFSSRVCSVFIAGNNVPRKAFANVQKEIAKNND